MYKNFDLKNIILIGIFDLGLVLINYNPIIPKNKNENKVINKVNIYN